MSFLTAPLYDLPRRSYPNPKARKEKQHNGNQTRVSHTDGGRHLRYTTLSVLGIPLVSYMKRPPGRLGNTVCVGRITTYDLHWSYEFGGLVAATSVPGFLFLYSDFRSI